MAPTRTIGGIQHGWGSSRRGYPRPRCPCAGLNPRVCWWQENFSVASPLADLTKDEVREASRELGLPNWNFAASPCLRSRLALNVEVSQPVGVHFALVLDSAGRL